MNSEEAQSTTDTTTTQAQAAPSSPTLSASAAAEAPKVNEVEAASTDVAATETLADDASPENLDANVRIAKDTSVRRLISFVMSRVERGGKVTLQALNLSVHKAITVALIVRDRLGDIYQVNSLLVVQETNEKPNKEGDDESQTRTSSGI